MEVIQLRYFYNRVISNAVNYGGVFGVRGVSIIREPGLFSKLTFWDAIMTTRVRHVSC